MPRTGDHRLTHLPTLTRPLGPSLTASQHAANRVFLGLVLAAALAVRLFVVATHSYIAHPDETFQYLEPAHRLAFGSGVITWEYRDGIRSWLLPGLIAGVMRAVALVDPDPAAYVTTLRVLCVLASLSVPFVGFQLAARRFGPAAGLLTGLLCAFALDVVYFAPVIMTEPLAADAALLAIWLGDGADRPTRRRLIGSGLLFGLALSLRYQYAPALAVAALLQHARAPRRLAIVAAATIAVAMPALGLLDQVTWGAPFQSVWLNYLRNATQGISTAMGAEPWWYYAGYYYLACIAASPLLGFAALGGLRVPALGGAVLCTVILHSLVAHKELRFVFLATAGMPILIGIGLAVLLNAIPRLRPTATGAPVAAAVALAVAGATGLATYQSATPADAWHRDRAMLQATAAARLYPGACGLGIRSIWVYRSGGYTYWHRDLPIYFETWDDAQKLDGTTFRLHLASVLAGRPVATYPGSALAANADKFNVMVGPPTDGLPGLSRLACYGSGSVDDAEYCVFARPGGCA